MTAKNRPSILASIMGNRPGRKSQEPQKIEVEAPSTVPESRRGKRGHTVWLDPAVIMRIKALALETGLSQQALTEEAYNLLFEKYGKPPIA